jgi:hypothetical protein
LRAQQLASVCTETPCERRRHFPLFNPQSTEVHVKALSEVLLKSAIGAVLRADKLEVTSAEIAGEGISFNAKSKSGQVRITGVFSDPQQELELEDDESAPVDEEEVIDPDKSN